MEKMVQFFAAPSPVVPRVAEKDVPRVRQGRPLLDAVANRRECPHLGRRVHHGRTCSRPARPCAAAGPAAATPRRGVGRGRVRSVAAVAAVAAIAATACRAGRCPARCAMSIYWCCASSHVVILSFCNRYFIYSSSPTVIIRTHRSVLLKLGERACFR